jgi:hypothetical protein
VRIWSSGDSRCAVSQPGATAFVEALVYSPRRGLLDFTVPLFAAYLREQHPLASFTDD